MAKKNTQNILIIIAIILLALFLFKGIGNGVEQEDIIITGEEISEYTTCQQLCQANNFDTGYSEYSVSDCRAGESFLTYGNTGEPPLLSCCCYDKELLDENGDEIPTIDCNDYCTLTRGYDYGYADVTCELWEINLWYFETSCCCGPHGGCVDTDGGD